MIEDLRSSARWTGHEDDHRTYNLIFDEAIHMLARDERALPSLLMAIINAWEKDERSIPLSILGPALAVAEEAQEMREMADASRDMLFKEPGLATD
jgi:hypothetical protein